MKTIASGHLIGGIICENRREDEGERGTVPKFAQFPKTPCSCAGSPLAHHLVAQNLSTVPIIYEKNTIFALREQRQVFGTPRWPGFSSPRSDFRSYQVHFKQLVTFKLIRPRATLLQKEHCYPSHPAQKNNLPSKDTTCWEKNGRPNCFLIGLLRGCINTPEGVFSQTPQTTRFSNVILVFLESKIFPVFVFWYYGLFFGPPTPQTNIDVENKSEAIPPHRPTSMERKIKGGNCG